MVGLLNRRRIWLVALALVVGWTIAERIEAQGSNGMAQGVVKDVKGTPVEGATVVFQSVDSSRKIETKTNNKGAYFQLGLAPGNYTLTAMKGEMVSVASKPVRIIPGQTLVNDFTILDKNAAARASAAGAAEADKAAAAKVAAFTTAFEAGVAASNAGRHDEAIAKFNEAFALSPTCYDCYNNIGYAYYQKKDLAQAEAAYLKANEVKPNQGSYAGLVNIYTNQKKLDLASAASAKATELAAASGAVGGNADALFNQGVTMWNSGKIDDAKKAFQAAVQANPNHAEAHYQLGMALVNEGSDASMKAAVAEFETYLKLSPTGTNAATAKSLIDTLKK
jgi:tetratricopeptide (TPR) repeat protein